jgi:hypothetical protein
MDSSTIFILSGAGFLMLILFVVLRKHYQKVIKKKERGIVFHLHEQDRLSKELEYTNVEKKVMEKMLETKFDNIIMYKFKNVKK